MALQNARLYSLEQRRATQLQAINSIAKHATSVLELDKLVHSCACCAAVFPRRITLACFCGGRGAGSERPARFAHTVTRGGETFPCEAELWNPAWIMEVLRSSRSFHNQGKTRLFQEAQSRISHSHDFLWSAVGLLVLSSREPNFFAHTETQPLESVADIFSAAIQNAN